MSTPCKDGVFTRRRATPTMGLAMAALFVLAASGCGLFTPATPDRPGGGGPGSTLPILTIDPDSAVASLVRGLEDKDQNLYLHGFADSALQTDVAFHAFFDSQDLFDYQVATGALPPSDWRHQDEATFIPQFNGLRGVPYEVYFTQDPNRPDDLLEPDRDVIYYRRYRIWAQAEPIAVGIADLRIQRVGVNGEWKIVQWIDRRDTTAVAIRTYGRRRLDAVR